MKNILIILFGLIFTNFAQANICSTQSGITFCFEEATTDPVTLSAENFKVADINNDGKLDIISKLDGAIANDIAIYLATDCTPAATNTFCYNTPHFTGLGQIRSFQLADMNGDGLTDIVARDLSNDLVLYVNDISLWPSSLPSSCNSIITSNPSALDGIYTIDPDGAGTIVGFDVYCDMNNQGGGWTMFAHHVDGLTNITDSTPPNLVNVSVFNDAQWQAVRDSMSVGIMLVDEQSRVSRISEAKLNGNLCPVSSQVSLITSGVPNGWAARVWDSNDSCTSGAPTAIVLADSNSNWGGYSTAGASIFNMAQSLNFDIWPYTNTDSSNEQNTLYYYIK